MLEAIKIEIRKMKKIIDYIKLLLSSSDEASSKRFISLFCLIPLFTTIIICSLFGIIIPEYYLLALVGLIGGSSLLTLFQKKDKE